MAIRLVYLGDDMSPVKDLFQEFRVDAKQVTDAQAIVDTLANGCYNGLILDIRKTLRLSPEEREKLQDTLDAFPSMRIRIDPDSGQIASMGPLRSFIEDTCARFEARSLRRSVRRPVHLPALLSREGDPEMEKCCRTHTMNISAQGVFLYSSEDWSGEHTAWVRFPDLEDDEPIKLNIEWVRPWGPRLPLSGIGATFAEMTQCQKATLYKNYLFVAFGPEMDVEEVQEEIEEFLAELSGGTCPDVA